MISFDKERCQGCSLCVESCPKKILFIDKSKVNSRGHSPIAISDENKCIQCALCAMMCPDVVIEVMKEVKGGTEVNEGK